MLINIATKTTVSESEFRSLNQNISFPEPMRDSDLFPFGYANVFYFAQPEVGMGFCVTQDGFAEIDGVWQANWAIVPKSPETLEAERINAVHNEIYAQEARLTPRAMREVMSSGDMTLVNEIDGNIAELRSQLTAVSK